ncbi:von Willebrand factor D and EGF domain-containing protein-like [Patella vulgata]|uniref:von Willebrand factor D and EGF domain-containing protein-like n=1 Tax=Patella vulgata TaxID=6465 RepID=UPI00217FF9E5|nr:von Willebrand factor D and EGF domain-containing protein-like [Patella vulgata]
MAQAYCTVTARYLPNGRWSEVNKSNVFVAVIELKTTTTVKLIEGQKAEHIDIKTNVPPQLLCPTGNKGQCHVQLVATITANKECRCSENIVFPQLVIGWKPSLGYTKPFCGSSVTVGNWESMIQIPVKATVDGLYDKDMYRYVHVVAVITGSIIHKTETHDIGKVKVQIYNRDYKATCASVNDPHITSFDGLHYNNFQTGEYIMYRHKTLPYEVRAYYKPCSSRRPTGPSCNCGVAVRSGDDVITLTGCASGSSSLYQKHHDRGRGRHHNTANPITIKMFKNGQLTPGTRIRRLGCGQKYEVLLPTGTYITVQSSYLSFINIWITASSMDYKQTEGNNLIFRIMRFLHIIV